MLQIFKSIKEISAKNLELGGLSLVIIDSVHLLEEENPIEHLEEMAADLNVTIIAIRDMNRVSRKILNELEERRTICLQIQNLSLYLQ